MGDESWTMTRAVYEMVLPPYKAIIEYSREEAAVTWRVQAIHGAYDGSQYNASEAMNAFGQPCGQAPDLDRAKTIALNTLAAAKFAWEQATLRRR